MKKNLLYCVHSHMSISCNIYIGFLIKDNCLLNIHIQYYENLFLYIENNYALNFYFTLYIYDKFQYKIYKLKKKR